MDVTDKGLVKTLVDWLPAWLNPLTIKRSWDARHSSEGFCNTLVTVFYVKIKLVLLPQGKPLNVLYFKKKKLFLSVHFVRTLRRVTANSANCDQPFPQKLIGTKECSFIGQRKLLLTKCGSTTEHWDHTFCCLCSCFVEKGTTSEEGIFQVDHVELYLC